MSCCPHFNKDTIEGIIVCSDCNNIVIELNREPEFNKNRCSYLTNGKSNSTISSELESLYLPSTVVTDVCTKYDNVAGDRIFRGPTKRALIVICLYYTLIERHFHTTLESLQSNFPNKIPSKKISKAQEMYLEKYPNAKTIIIKPENLVGHVLTLLKFSESDNFKHRDHIIKLISQIVPKKEEFRRSFPLSVTSAIVYLYLCLNPEIKEQYHIDKIEFSKKVKLSHITVIRLAKIASKVIDKDERLIY